MGTRCVAPCLETRGCSPTGHSLSSFLTFPLIQTFPFLTSFLPKVRVNLLRSAGLCGEPATWSCSRLRCYLGGGSSGNWNGQYPESDSQCGEWGLLGLQVGEARSTLGLCAGPVTSHGVPKGDQTTSTLNAVPQISNSASMIIPELLEEWLDSTGHQDWTCDGPGWVLGSLKKIESQPHKPCAKVTFLFLLLVLSLILWLKQINDHLEYIIIYSMYYTIYTIHCICVIIADVY